MATTTKTRRTRSTTAPKAKEMWQEPEADLDVTAEPAEEVDAEEQEIEVSASDGKIEVADEAEEPTGKLSFMKIDPDAAPGNSALAILTPDRLKELAFISTYYSQDPQSTSPRRRGYQREPMTSRFRGIGRFFATGDNRHLITPIIASVRIPLDDVKAQKRFVDLFNHAKIDKIHDEFGQDVFSIVDGQHRLGGLFWAWENISDFNAEIPVYVYFGLGFIEEATFFDVVNTEQRKLPKALIESTKLHTESGTKSRNQTIREIANAIAEDGNSVWNGLVNMAGNERDKPITFEGMRRSVGNMFPEKLLARLAQRGMDPAEVGKRYWDLVSRTCAPAWDNRPRVEVNDDGERVEVPIKYRIKDLVGVAALSKLGQDILTSALDSTRVDEDFWEVVGDDVSKLGAVDWEKRRDNPWMRSSAGFAGMNDLAKMLWDLVYLGKSPGVSASPEADAADDSDE